ncbi:MAG: CO dehydrogenase/CO-methylating acetyl-CoA synthase complex subunit beta, partial [Oscillospiraceae bacterium]|nr:CO dehydrogenase/CO-methylating acetyl-CoA synthase complex subunit beta [Oscillospiraceae bacterium]
MGLFDNVFRGSDEMYEKAEQALSEIIAKVGADAPVQMPDTAYNCACILAYMGRKIEKLSDLKDALDVIRTDWMTREYRTKSVFTSGIGTAMAAEIIEVCKYIETSTPYEGTKYHGHFSDAEVRELGVPLVTGDIPGFVVIIDEAPSDQEAFDLIKGYQSRGIFVFLIGGIIDQAERMGINMGFPVRVVATGKDIWSVSHVIS